jgi:hypothetical protein
LGHGVYHAPDVLANVLLAVGIAELYGRQAGRLGKLGKVGFYLSVIGFASTALLALGIVLAEGVFGISAPALDVVHFLVLPVALGALLFGLALLRAGAFPRGGALLITIAPLALLGTIVGRLETLWLLAGLMVLFGAGWARLGYDISSKNRATRRASRVS